VTGTAHPSFAPRLLTARDEAPAVRTFRFVSPPGFSFVPGQFLMFHFGDDPKTCRAYSLCSSPADAANFFEVTVGMVGAFSDRLGAVTPDSEHALVARGPFGKWTCDGTAPHAVLIAGGTGVTPFRAMCLNKRDRKLPGRITLCCSAKTPELILYRGEHAPWRKSGIEVIERVTGGAPGWNGLTGRWTAENVITASGNDPDAVYFLCGPNKMVQELREGLQIAGVPPEKVRTEKWGDYADLI
jgi:ferredoxin-NADP reductase